MIITHKSSHVLLVFGLFLRVLRLEIYIQTNWLQMERMNIKNVKNSSEIKRRKIRQTNSTFDIHILHEQQQQESNAGKKATDRRTHVNSRKFSSSASITIWLDWNVYIFFCILHFFSLFFVSCMSFELYIRIWRVYSFQYNHIAHRSRSLYVQRETERERAWCINRV